MYHGKRLSSLIGAAVITRGQQARMESSLVRIRVAVVGTRNFRRLRVDTSAEESAARLQIDLALVS